MVAYVPGLGIRPLVALPRGTLPRNTDNGSSSSSAMSTNLRTTSVLMYVCIHVHAYCVVANPPIPSSPGNRMPFFFFGMRLNGIVVHRCTSYIVRKVTQGSLLVATLYIYFLFFHLFTRDFFIKYFFQYFSM
jgi:hypothetical protein